MIRICLAAATLLCLSTLTPAADDLVVADFESGSFDGWQATGTAFGNSPIDLSPSNQMQVSNWRGKFYVNGYHGRDESTGTLTSPTFTVERDYLQFLVGGGKLDELSVNLLSGGEIVRRATGPQAPEGMSERLQPVQWNVADLRGKDVRIQVVDEATGQWGHLNVDTFIQTDRAMPQPEENVTVNLVGNGMYLHLPVNDAAERRKFDLLVDGKAVRWFDVRFAPEDPAYFVTLSLDQFIGSEVELKVDQWTGDAELQRQDEPANADKLYHEDSRPQFHFTAQQGWINDPNGMVHADGKWHLYFQHNPFGWESNQKHWGHAVSEDLVHWTEVETALSPHAYRDEVYSGSAVLDSNNTSDWGTADNPPLVAAYTSTARGECIVFSTDGGMTFTEFEGNPVVVHDEIGRDPRLLWDEASNQWVMAVYYDKAGKQWIGFWTSDDLKDWRFASEIEGFYECPDFVELAVNGDEDNTRWVLYGADGGYLIGAWDGQTFEPSISRKQYTWYGKNYAAQTFSHASDGLTIQVGWMRNSDFPGEAFNQQMSAFVTLMLKDTGDEGVRLFAWPIEEYESIRGTAADVGETELAGDPETIGSGEMLDIEATFELGDARTVGMTIRGRELTYDTTTHRLRYGDIDAPLPVMDGTLELRILVDRGSVEIFAEGGYVVLAESIRPGEGDEAISVFARDGKAKLKSATLYPMRSMWK